MALSRTLAVLANLVVSYWLPQPYKQACEKAHARLDCEPLVFLQLISGFDKAMSVLGAFICMDGWHLVC